MFYSNYAGNVGLSGEVLLQASPAECDRTTWRCFYGLAISLLFVPMYLEKRSRILIAEVFITHKNCEHYCSLHLYDTMCIFLPIEASRFKKKSEKNLPGEQIFCAHGIFLWLKNRCLTPKRAITSGKQESKSCAWKP